MKKKISIFFAVLLVIACLTALMVITASAEEKQITISYLNHHNPFNPDPGFDTSAYENGQQVVKVGEEFTLPTTSSHSFEITDGYQLRWYTPDGRSYKGGETVSFDKDTRLYRVVAKEVHDIEQLNSAMTSNSHAAVLMEDISYENIQISVWGENQAVLDLGGHDITVSRNGTIMGGERAANIVIGKGTIKATNPDKKVGTYQFFSCKGHGYNGDETETLVGRDVTIDAPNFYLGQDGQGDHVAGFAYIKICGKVNVYYILHKSNGTNAVRVDFMETCEVRLTAPYLNIDYKAPTDTTVYNNVSFNITIYGGIFRLPTEASTEFYWSTDNYATEKELTENNKDNITILGGTFILPNGAKPAIDRFLEKAYILAINDHHDGINFYGLKNKNNDTTAYINYLIPGGYKLFFNRNGSLTVTDNVGTGKGGVYYFTLNLTEDGFVETISLFTDAEKTNPTDVFEMKAAPRSTWQIENSKDTPALLVAFDEINPSTAMNTTTLLSTGVTALIPTNCEHSFEPTTSTTADCITYATQSYKCSLCGHEYTVPYGEYSECIWELVKDVPPTMTIPGVKTYCCEICGDYMDELYYFDIANENIEVIVKGNVKVSVKTGDVFELTSLGDNKYRLTGIKAFGEYAIADIIEINIPMGISEVNFANNNSTVVKMNIMDGADLTVTSFAKLSALTEITIGKATVVFPKNCINSVIQAIHSDVEGANVTFNADLFYQKTQIQELTLSTGSTYSFGNQSFRRSGLKELIFPDNSTIKWESNAFAECQQLEYIYFGSNIGVKQITNGSAVFDGISNLKKVVIMDLTYLGEWAFSTKKPGESYGPLCDLTMYIHSEALTMHANCLNTRNGNYNVYVYTVQTTLPSAINNCNYTIYQGIPHELTEGYKAPTCTEAGGNGYTTECPCGAQLSGSVTVKKYVKTFAEYEELVYTSEVIPATGHDMLGDIVSLVYTSFLEKGDGTYVCSVCGVTHSKEDSANALFIFRGYSTREDGTAFCIDYGIDMEAIKNYEKANGVTIDVGVFAVASEKLGDKAPHEIMTEGGVKHINAKIPDIDIDNFTLKIKGFDNDDLQKIELVMTAYMTITSIVDDVEQVSTIYIQKEQTDKPSAYSMAQYLEDISSANQ